MTELTPEQCASTSYASSECFTDDCSITLLPTEVLLKVWSYLPVVQRVRCESVCRFWRCSMNYHDVTQLDLSPGAGIKSPRVPGLLCSLVRRLGFSLVELRLSEFELCSSELLNLADLARLRSLRLHNLLGNDCKFIAGLNAGLQLLELQASQAPEKSGPASNRFEFTITATDFDHLVALRELRMTGLRNADELAQIQIPALEQLVVTCHAFECDWLTDSRLPSLKGLEIAAQEVSNFQHLAQLEKLSSLRVQMQNCVDYEYLLATLASLPHLREAVVACGSLGRSEGLVLHLPAFVTLSGRTFGVDLGPNGGRVITLASPD